MLAAILVLALATACSGNGDANDDGDGRKTPSAAQPPSPTIKRDQPPADDGPATRCLFTIPQVSRVLGGSWQRDPQDAACVYSSDRGAVFVTTPVEAAIKQALREARDACLAGIRPITVENGFVCVEEIQGKEFIIGNAVAHDRPWVINIAPLSGTASRPELRAMMELVGAADGN